MYKRVQDLKTEITCPREKDQKTKDHKVGLFLFLLLLLLFLLPSLDMRQTEYKRMCTNEAPNLIYTGGV